MEHIQDEQTHRSPCHLRFLGRCCLALLCEPKKIGIGLIRVGVRLKIERIRLKKIGLD